MSAVVHEPPGVAAARVLVLSPHLDDAVLSCGHLVAAADTALVVTTFTGTPAAYPSPLPRWDRQCGFTPGTDVVAVRRAEDLRATAVLGAGGHHLGFVDLPYRNGESAPQAEIAAAIARVVREFAPTTVALPLAIQHPDHRATLQAGLAAREKGDDRDWVCYAEFPYVWREEHRTFRRLGAVSRQGYRLTPVLLPAKHVAAKAEALRCYASQLVGLELDAQVECVAEAPEQYWRISDSPPLAVRAGRWTGYRLGILQ